MDIVLIEDESGIADAVRYALSSEGMTVRWFMTAGEGLESIAEQLPDLVVLDVGLPDVDGFECCRRIQQIGDVPVIFLTARADEIDRVVGLEIGADDYMVKPFSPRELSARVRAVLRRCKPSAAKPTSLLDLPFAIDESSKQISFHGRVLQLSAQQYILLRVLIQQADVVLSRAELKAACWDDPAMVLDRVVDTHVKEIRSKLRAVDESGTDWITTHRGFGYALSISRT